MNRHPDESVDVTIQPGKLRQVRPRDLAIRFAFGATVSVVAGVISLLAGRRIGGVWLAFPAILLASATLIADEENTAEASNDIRGAAYGSVGLFAFALVATLLFGRVSWWLVLIAASAAWTFAALGTYAVARRLGHGVDEKRG